MNTHQNRRILVIAPPGRKRENLFTMLISALQSYQVTFTDTCQQALQSRLSSAPALVLIDDRNPDRLVETNILEIVHMYPRAVIALLKNRLCPYHQTTGLALREVLYDDLTITILDEWVQASRLREELLGIKDDQNWREEKSYEMDR